MAIYGFKDKVTAEKLRDLAQGVDVKTSTRLEDGNDVATRVSYSQTVEEIPGKVTGLDGTQMIPAGNCEKYQTSNEEETARIFRHLGIPTTVNASNIEETNIPTGADVVTLSDGFNSHFYLTPTPSECFATLDADWAGDYETAVTVTLDDGFTIGNLSVATVYPAPTLDSSETIPAGTKVEVRYVKSVGKWFFFRPRGGRQSYTGYLGGRWYEGGSLARVFTPALPSKLHYRTPVTGEFPAASVRLDAVRTHGSNWVWVCMESVFDVTTEGDVGSLLDGAWLAYPLSSEDDEFWLDMIPVYARRFDGTFALVEDLGADLVSSSGSRLGPDGTIDGSPCYTTATRSEYLYYDTTRSCWAYSAGFPTRDETNTGTGTPPTIAGFSETYGAYTVTCQPAEILPEDVPPFGVWRFTESASPVSVSLAEDYRSGSALTGEMRVTLAHDWSRDALGNVLVWSAFKKTNDTITAGDGNPEKVQYSGTWTSAGQITFTPILPTVPSFSCPSFREYLETYDMALYPILQYQNEYYIPDPESSQGRWSFPEGLLSGTCVFSDGTSSESYTLYELYTIRENLIYGEKDGVSGFFLGELFHPAEGSPLMEEMTLEYVFAEELTQTIVLDGLFDSETVEPNLTVSFGIIFAEPII